MQLRTVSLAGLRVTLGLLMVAWGLDKILNTGHAVRVSESFYLGLVTGPGLWKVLGAAQVLLGVLVVIGWLRKFTYPVLIAATGVTFVAVWRSIVDPLGLVLDGANLIFFPSSTIFLGALVVLAFRAEDTLAVDAATSRRAEPH